VVRIAINRRFVHLLRRYRAGRACQGRSASRALLLEQFQKSRFSAVLLGALPQRSVPLTLNVRSPHDSPRRWTSRGVSTGPGTAPPRPATARAIDPPARHTAGAAVRTRPHRCRLPGRGDRGAAARRDG
jgi:hypothetical protein